MILEDFKGHRSEMTSEFCERVFTPLCWQPQLHARSHCVSRMCHALSLSRGAWGVGDVRGGVQLTPLSTSFCISKNIQKFISHQRASSSAGAAAWLKTMSFNVLKMSCKVLLPKVPLAYDPLHSNIKWHAWLFSWNKSFLVITVICGSRPYTPITPVWGISVSVSIWEREREEKNNCRMKPLKRNLMRQ